MSSPISYFVSRAPTYMALLMKDFEFDELDAAAIMGNAGHESGGLTIWHEVGQPDNKGGVGWFQWTGSRRRDYEAYCERNNFNPHTDESNYKFLYTELKGSESAAINKTKAAVGLEAKVKAFEMAFERAGVKAYDSRLTWAQRALDAFNATDVKPVPIEKPIENPTIASLIQKIKEISGAQKVSIVLE